MCIDGLVHRGLRVTRLVTLVVAVTAVPHQIDDAVFPVRLPVHHGETDGGNAFIGVIGVDVNDGNVKALREIRGEIG